jgi:hypothetical protein
VRVGTFLFEFCCDRCETRNPRLCKRLEENSYYSHNSMGFSYVCVCKANALCVYVFWPKFALPDIVLPLLDISTEKTDPISTKLCHETKFVVFLVFCSCAFFFHLIQKSNKKDRFHLTVSNFQHFLFTALDGFQMSETSRRWHWHQF